MGGVGAGGLSLRRPGRELELERRGSCNPLGAVSSWLSGESQPQEAAAAGGGGSGVGKGGQGSATRPPAGPDQRGEQTESALLAQFLFLLVPVSCQGCPSFCRGIT